MGDTFGAMSGAKGAPCAACKVQCVARVHEQNFGRSCWPLRGPEFHVVAFAACQG